MDASPVHLYSFAARFVAMNLSNNTSVTEEKKETFALWQDTQVTLR
jgi:uncharacterized membrane protein